MNQSRDVLSHWHKVYENFETSSLAFYEMVEQEIGRWKIPDVQFSRVEWSESGALSSRRIYLRVTRGPLDFDICAAPYGTGYFFSWWLATPSKRLLAWIYFVVVLFLTVFGPVLLGILMEDRDGVIIGALLGWVSLILLAIGVRDGRRGDEEAVIAMPFFGRLYAAIFRPITYFEIDTTYMFQEAVRHAVLEVIETVTTARGIRELSELERQPMAFGRGRQAGASRRIA